MSLSWFQTWLLRISAAGLILLLQGPAMLTQEIAWAGMLMTYTRDCGLARGVAKTFDGNHPCKMCLKAAKLEKDGVGERPAENRRDESARTRLAWAEMVFSKWPDWKNPQGVGISVEEPTGSFAVSGCGREAPVPPPPRRV